MNNPGALGQPLDLAISEQISRRPADTARQTLRVGLICDFLEEEWPSMDLIGDMLAIHLRSEDLADIGCEQLRPPLRARFSRLPWLGRRQPLWNVDRLINRFVDYPRWLGPRKTSYDVFHLVDHSYSQLVHYLPQGRTVVTCHDLDTFRCLLDVSSEKNRPRWFRVMTRRILEGLQQAAHVIAVSDATRQQLLRMTKIPGERISVIHNGVHPSCSMRRGVADRDTPALLGIDANEPVLLSVGSTLARKRLDVLLRVFAEVRKQIPEARLVRVGGFAREHEQLGRELGVWSAAKILPGLDRDQLAAVYRCSTLLLQTSEAEGFGLPVVEALACGCPVVASDIAILREVGGDAASYCNVGDIRGWTETIVSLLQGKIQNSNSWDVRRQKGADRARQFSWEQNARKTAEIYRGIGNAGRS